MVNVIIQKTRIIGTHTVVYSAWERDVGRNHSTITFIDGVQYGRMGTTRLESSFAAGTDERIADVRAQREALYQAAYAAILGQFPNLKGVPERGEIRVEEG